MPAERAQAELVAACQLLTVLAWRCAANREIARAGNRHGLKHRARARLMQLLRPGEVIDWCPMSSSVRRRRRPTPDGE